MDRSSGTHPTTSATIAAGQTSGETYGETYGDISLQPKNAVNPGPGKFSLISPQVSLEPESLRDPRGRFDWKPVFRGDGFTIVEGKGVSGQLERSIVYDTYAAKIAAETKGPETKGPEPVVRRQRAISRAALGKLANTVRNDVDQLPESPAGRKWLLKRRATPWQRERVRSCRHKRVVRNSVQVSTDGTGVSIAGISTCGSARDCPVCAPNIYAGRANEIKKACVAHRANGGLVLMATFTVRHQGCNDLKWLSQAVAEAFRAMRRSRRFQAFWKAELGIAWVIRGDEQTHGPNGWHPHLHVLVFVPKESELAKQATKATARKQTLNGRTSDLVYTLFERWSECVERRLGSAFLPTVERGVVVSLSTDDDYLTKLGLEVAFITTKSGRTDQHRTPWELLQDATDGDMKAQRLWQEHSRAMLGRRQISWSRDMKNHFAVDEKTDEEFAQEELDRQKPRVCFDIAAWLWDYLDHSEPLWLACFVRRLLRSPAEAEELLPPKDSEAGRSWTRFNIQPSAQATGPPYDGEREPDYWRVVRPIGLSRWAAVWKDVRLRQVVSNARKNH